MTLETYIVPSNVTKWQLLCNSLTDVMFLRRMIFKTDRLFDACSERLIHSKTTLLFKTID